MTGRAACFCCALDNLIRESLPWESLRLRNCDDAFAQRALVSIWKQQPADLVLNELGETARCARYNRYAVHRCFECNESEWLSPDGRRDQRPRFGQLGLNALMGNSSCKRDTVAASNVSTRSSRVARSGPSPTILS